MAEISVSDLAGFGLANVLPRRGIAPEAVGGALGFAVVSGPVTSQGRDVALLGTGPNQWLAFADAASPDWAGMLGDTLANVAGVVDQSSAYVGWRITGADARQVLQKGLPVDLATIAPGAVVVSTIAHLGVIVHCTAPERFDIFVFRSFAINFREWLDASIAAV